MNAHSPIVFDPKLHAYTCDGRFVPGVTAILSAINKPALVQWAANMASEYALREILRLAKPINGSANVEVAMSGVHVVCKEAKTAHRKFSKAAADIGSNVHAYAEAVFKKLPCPELTTEEAKRGAKAFHEWLEKHRVQVIESERVVFSRNHWFAGTCDFTAEIDGELCVGDLKTSSGIWPEMLLQTAAYQHAIEEETKGQFKARWIVRLSKKDGQFEAKRFGDSYLGDFEAFRACLTLHKHLQRLDEKLKAQRAA